MVAPSGVAISEGATCYWLQPILSLMTPPWVGVLNGERISIFWVLQRRAGYGGIRDVADVLNTISLLQ